MEFNDVLSLIKAKIGVIIIFTAVFFVLGVGLTLAQPLKYSSDLRLLVVQDASGSADPYTAARATEYLSDVLSKVAYSGAFFNQVLGSGLAIETDYFGSTRKQISKNWARSINVRPINNTGIIMVSAYHTDRDQAERIARAIGHVLISRHGDYHGLGTKMVIKLLDDPITSKYPVKPNLAINAVLSVLVGLAGGLLFVYWQAEKKTWKQSATIAVEQNQTATEAETEDFFAEGFKPIAGSVSRDLPVSAKNVPRFDWSRDF